MLAGATRITAGRAGLAAALRRVTHNIHRTVWRCRSSWAQARHAGAVCGASGSGGCLRSAFAAGAPRRSAGRGLARSSRERLIDVSGTTSRLWRGLLVVRAPPVLRSTTAFSTPRRRGAEVSRGGDGLGPRWTSAPRRLGVEKAVVGMPQTWIVGPPACCGQGWPMRKRRPGWFRQPCRRGCAVPASAR
jgi:hypothetical protein